MKRFLASVLLALILLNSVGFYGLFWVLEKQQAHRIGEQFEQSGYQGFTQKVFKMPLILPYGYYQEKWQPDRIEGGFEHEGRVYRLLEQQLVRDTLYLLP